MAAVFLWLFLVFFSPEGVCKGMPQPLVELLLRDKPGNTQGFPEGFTMVYYFKARVIVLYDKQGRALAKPAPFLRRLGE